MAGWKFYNDDTEARFESRTIYVIVNAVNGITMSGGNTYGIGLYMSYLGDIGGKKTQIGVDFSAEGKNIYAALNGQIIPYIENNVSNIINALDQASQNVPMELAVPLVEYSHALQQDLRAFTNVPSGKSLLTIGTRRYIGL